MIDARGHHHHIPLRGIGFRKHVAQIGEVLWIAYGDQDASRPDLHGLGGEFFAGRDPELLELMLLPSAVLRLMRLGDGEDAEQRQR